MNRNLRKERIGIVESNKMEKSIIVSIKRKVKHPLYGKFVKKTSRFFAHDEENTCNEGDIVNVDVTAIVDEYYGDTSRMFTIGNISVKAKNLIDATYECMMKGIEILKPGTKLGDIGFTIQSYIEEKGFSVVRDFCGHGISNKFHEQPNILHYGKKNTGLELSPGMTFTVEPMINAGNFDIKIQNDGWTAVSKDKSLSAQFEHTLGITEDSYEIFTESVKGYRKPPYN